MNKRLLITMTVLMLVTVTMMAVPAKPVKKKVVTAEGKTIEVTLRGDEYYSFYTDNAGNPYRLNVGQRVERITMDEVDERWAACKKARLQAVKPASDNYSRRAPRRVGTAGNTIGNKKGLVILIEFTDVKFSISSPNEAYRKFFNKEGYTENGMTGSVRDYFLAQSYNQLAIDFDVVGPYTTKNDLAFYGAAEGDRHDRAPQSMIIEAVDNANNDVDFADYDWDNDGEVDQVFIIFAGYSQAQGGPDDSIWPHESHIYNINNQKKYDGKIVDTYGCASELRGGSGTEMDGIGTACHEFSHCLGLPDMYDINYNGGFGTSYFDVMCSGSYNNSSRTPAGYTSYERWFAGWMEPVELNTLTRVSDMKPLATTPEAYILYNDKNKNEYYLLENRQPVGFDKGLYGAHGLLILHVDYSQAAWNSNTVNTTASHQRMTYIPADNRLNDSSVSELRGDPWPGLKGNTMLTNFTTPAATLYNDNTDGTKFMNKNIDCISENDSAMTVSFVACRPDMTIPNPDDGTAQVGSNSFTVTWPAVSGATSYELELTEVGTAATDPADALEREFDFAKFKTSSAGFTDLANANGQNKLGDYGLAGWSGEKLYTSPKYMKIGTTKATGYLRTATWDVPQSSDMTIVMGAEPGTAGSAVDGQLQVAFGNVGESAAYSDQDFSVTDNAKQVFHFSIMKNRFWLEIRPEAMMYLNYLAIYDGTWTAEQLGINGAAAPVLAPLRASTVTNYTTNTNSYTFTNVKTRNRFIYRVRALSDEGYYSAWSESKTFSFGTTAIEDHSVLSSDITAPVRYFDLQGREVDASHRGLVIMQQGNTVKKVIR